jgi:3-phenylpropionate/cinnamic acid dioxygenase small subunit
MADHAAEGGLERSVEVSAQEFFEISRFLTREAQLLDERRYLDWLALLHEDVEYRAPIRRFRQADGTNEDWSVEKELSPKGELQLTLNGHAQMKVRIDRLLSGKAHTESPPWFIERLVTNIDARRIESADRSSDSYVVASKFLLNRFKAGREQTIVGSRRDSIVRDASEPGFRLRRRDVLFNADSYRWGAYVLI